MKIANTKLYYEIHLYKCFFLNDNKELIYFKHFYSIKKAKLDESNNLKDKIIIFKDTQINDYVPISDDQLCIIYNKLDSHEQKYKKVILIKSLKNDNFYEIPTFYEYNDYKVLVKFFKEKNQLIIFDYANNIYFWKFNEHIQTYQFFLKLFIDKNFEFNILNANTFIISTNDCLLFYDANTLKIKKKIYFDDEEEIDENNEDKDEYEYDVDVGTEGNYENEVSKKNSFSSCLSNDKKYLAISNMQGRLFIYNTKNFKKEKIKKFQNFRFSFLPFYSYNKKELEKINTIKICYIKPVSNFFALGIDYVFTINNKIEYDRDLVPLKKIGKIWEFGFFVE